MTCGCLQSDDHVCPCEHDGRCALTIRNPSGLARIAYRAGDFASFRHALVRHGPGEAALAGWRPTSEADLALQVADWWAYVGDVLTFYSERIANESFVPTAVLPESVRHLVALLGYRPRPGIGAHATLAVLAAGPGRVVLPAGFAVQSKGVPGIDPQTFELGKGVTFAAPTSVAGPPPEEPGTPPGAAGPPDGAPAGTAAPPPRDALIVRGGVLVKGKASGIAVGDRLLLVRKPWSAVGDHAAVVTVTGLVTERDAHRRQNTRVLLSGTGGLANAKAKDYALRRPSQTAHLTTVPAGATVVGATSLVLDGTARHLRAGDPLLVELPGAGSGAHHGSGFAIVRLSAYTEVVWYANGAAGTPKTSPGDHGIPLLVAELTIAAPPGANMTSAFGGTNVAMVAVRSGWTDVGTLLDTPVRSVQGLPPKVTLARPPAAAAGTAAPAVVEDARGRGAAVAATPAAGGSEVALAPAAGAEAAGTLEPPLRLLWDLIEVTRGETVRDELLGAGDATVAGQDLVLSRSPVTYLPGGGSRSGDGYSSTIELVVDGVRWDEAPRFLGRGGEERIFVTREDDEGRTHVLLGDGVHGARPATGARITATYRVGSGATVPPVGTLTQILRPAPNLDAVRNPVRAAGGADPDPPERLRELAPRSVLTFGRAVSGDDYAVVAAQTPGVRRASAEWSWDPGEQRPVVRVHVGDDAAAVTAARAALRAQGDPNRPVVVVPAVACTTVLLLTLRCDPAYRAEDLVAAVRDVLLTEVFTPAGLRLGAPLYRSRIEHACDLPGVLAVHDLRMIWWRSDTDDWHDETGPRFAPGAGGWFDLHPDCLHIGAETATDG